MTHRVAFVRTRGVTAFDAAFGIYAIRVQSYSERSTGAYRLAITAP